MEILETLRISFSSGRTLPISFRTKQLDQLYRCVDENMEGILKALYMDLRKCELEGSYEVNVVKKEIGDVRRALTKWGFRKRKSSNLLLLCDSTAFVQRDPYGVVLIIAPWNFPFILTLLPLIGAIAGGNCAIVKPSENAPYSSTKLAELIPKYLDPECYKIVEGGVKEIVAILDQKFDHIFATCSTKIGRSIMQSAAKNLTPVTLELGGKSPVYIDEDCNIEIATKRILWGKCLSMGQTCLSPDYILCSKAVQQKFLEQAQLVLEKWYGKNPQNSPDLARIINPNHFSRLWNLLCETNGQIVYGGSENFDDLYISPTIVVNVKCSDILMQDEIFGPILPILTVNSKEEAVQLINGKPKPLALYVFSRSRNVLEFFTKNTSSGTFCGNDVITHIAWQEMPFGGVGDSGMGRYLGKYSYKAFTHPKSVVFRSQWKFFELLQSIRYAPYNWHLKFKIFLIATTLEQLHRFKGPSKSWLAYLFIFVLGIMTAFLFEAFAQMDLCEI